MALPAPSGLIGALEERRAELRRFLVARTGSEADADDLLNELWIKAKSGGSGPIAHPASYVFRMANNLVLDRLRESRRRERRDREWTADRHGLVLTGEEAAADRPSPEAELIQREESRRLALAIEQLPEGARRVLRMHKLEGLSHAEVAAALGISKSAVEKHMAVAMTHLRRLLEELR